MELFRFMAPGAPQPTSGPVSRQRAKVRAVDPRTPVIVGAGQVSGGGEVGPIALAARALRLAAEDAGGTRLLERADSARHVATICWPYTDEAALIASELGVTPRETVRSSQFGGDGPGRLVSDTARAIAAGEVDVALLSGAEAVSALRAAQREQRSPDWPDQPAEAKPTRTIGTDRFASNEAETAVGLLAPVYNYALLETAVQGCKGRTRDNHAEAIADLWSRFSEVAVDNPHAQIKQRFTASELRHRTPDNRPVSEPYSKLLTANIQVDQATGLIMCSAQAARDAGVPTERWVFPLAGAYAADEWFMTERPELAASPAIAAAGTAALTHANATIDEVTYVDLYSCFPSAVQIAADALGLDTTARTPTLTGGLTFAGGPGNNYASHGVATTVAKLREDPEALALCTALGWYATKHAVLVLTGRPGERAYREFDANPATRPQARMATASYTGPATVEAYTIPYDRAGEPEALVISALTPDGTRALTRITDKPTIEDAITSDPIGRRITV
jgi:acetyl-CoA C-acetyltransferase